MTAILARMFMRLTIACLGDDRRNWAIAMQAEFAFAAHDGKALRFAAGCLMSALREMPTSAEGRFTLASHVIAVCLLPLAALLVVGTASGYPFLPSGPWGISSWLTGGGEQLRLLTPWNRGFAPVLMLLIWGLIAGHLLMPWFILERNWTHIGTLARVNSAATVTLLLFTGALFLDGGFMLLPAVALAVELLAIWLLYSCQTHIIDEWPTGTLTT